VVSNPITIRKAEKSSVIVGIHFRLNCIVTLAAVLEYMMKVENMSKSMQEAILTLTELTDECHPSHLEHLRYSDSSFYDVKCKRCGHHDEVPGGWELLRKPCDGGTVDRY
jgi:hypothetical protein